jgi:trimethylamine---corrinoid protein Co-methyltransferase
MKPLSHFYKLLTDIELEKLHENAAALLSDPGMKFESRTMLEALQKKGAKVDFDTQTARLPKKLIEETIEIACMEELERIAGKDLKSETGFTNRLTFSWHTPYRSRTPEVQASFGGGAPLFYDYDKKINRYATGEDFLRMVNLAEGLPEIVTVGNAVHYIKEKDGSDVAPKMVAIKGAALVAKYSSKPGCTTVIDKRQLPYLMEMGRIVKGSEKEYLKSPIFVNIHDTEPPLRLTRPEASLIEAMIDYDLGIFILPMPLAGISSPVYPAAAAIIGAAEILGVWTAAKAIKENIPVEASCVSGVLNPQNGAACFATPEASMIDLAVAQLFREKYGVPCGTGVGLIDAPVPGPLSIFERTFKAMASALIGEPAFAAGLIGGGVVFSMEQAIIDLDIAGCQNRYVMGIGGDEFYDALELIREKGIGGLFIDTDHTVKNFRNYLNMTKVLKNLKSTSVEEAVKNDPVYLAHERCLDVLESTPLYFIGEDKAKEIDKLVDAAEKELASLRGALN